MCLLLALDDHDYNSNHQADDQQGDKDTNEGGGVVGQGGVRGVSDGGGRLPPDHGLHGNVTADSQGLGDVLIGRGHSTVEHFLGQEAG